MIYILFIINMLLAFAACGFWWKKRNIVFLIVTCFLTFFCEYIICSGLLFWCDHFSIINVLVILTVINLVFMAAGWVKRRSWFQIEWDLRPYIIPLVIALCILPFTWSKFEYFGMGQDQGVYQTHAIALINGYDDLQLDFKEYDTLETQEEKDYFKEMLQTQLVGLYNYDPDLPFASQEAEKSDVSAVFHGVPTFASVLALWGSMFGISHMAGIQTLFFLCAIFLLNFCLDRLKIKSSVKIIVTAIFALSPLILWSSKSSLTEIELACFVLMFIYFILGTDKRDVYYSLVPVAAFSFFHITIYTMIPVFLMAYGILYICKKKNAYIISCIGAIVIFAVGITMIQMIAGTYSYGYNFWPIYNLVPLINTNNVAYVIIFVCLLCCIACILVWCCNPLRKLIFAILYRIRYLLFYGLLIFTAIIAIKNIVNTRETFHGFLGSITHSTIIGYGLVTGVFFLAFAGIMSLFKGRLLLKQRQSMIVFIMFFYCICFYSVFMRPSIEYYYYYGRYLVPYVAITLLYSALVFQTMSIKWTYVIGGISIIFILPYSILFVNHKDDTRVTWNVIYNLSSIITEQDAIVINPEDMKYYFLTLSSMTDAWVYPASENYTEQMVDLQEKGFENVYIITSDQNVSDQINVVYEDFYEMSQDNNEYTGKYVPFPQNFTCSTEYVLCGQLK